MTNERVGFCHGAVDSDQRQPELVGGLGVLIQK